MRPASIAWRLYLLLEWTADTERCAAAGIPETVGFQSKPQIALEQIQAACAAGPSAIRLASRRSRSTCPRPSWQTISWREGSAGALSSRVARVRVRAAHRDEWRAAPRGEEWLLIERPRAG
jgi:SRSO17 transposase